MVHKGGTNLKIVLLIIILICFIDYTTAEDLPSKEQEALFVAQKAQEDGFYETAINLYERFLVNWPQSKNRYKVNFYLGQCYFLQGRYLEALKKFDELLSHPEAREIKDGLLYWMAELRFRNNDFTQAINLYRQIIEEFPKSNYIVSSYYSLGWCLYELKQYAQALDYFRKVVQNFPHDDLAGQAKLKIMDCLYALKDYKGLKDYVNSYLKDYPQKTQPNLNYITFYQAEAEYYLGNFETASELYLQLIKNTSDERLNSLGKLGLGWCYIKMAKYKEAEQIFNQLVDKKLDKKDYEIFLLGRAYVFNQTNRFEEAIKDYSELINFASGTNLIEAYLGKGLSLYNLGRYSEAIEVYNACFKNTDLGNLEAGWEDRLHYNLGWAYLKEGRFKEAIAEFKKVASISEDKMVKIASLCLAADTYQDAGQYNKAIQSYEQILKDYPDNLYVDYIQYQLGNCFLKLSDYESAILSFKYLITNFPRSKLIDEATYALGLVYFQKEEFSKVIDVLKNFPDNFKDSYLSADASYLYALSLYNLQRYKEAEEVFRRIIKDYSENRDLVQKAEFEIADCLYQQGKEREALELFNLLRVKYPDSEISAEALWWLGGYYWRLNKPEISKRYLEMIIQNFPNNNIISDAYYTLGFIYAEEGELNKAMDFFKKAKEIGEPDLAGQAMIAMGDILVKQNNFSSALELYNQVLTDYPHLSSLVYPKIAQAYSSLGNLAEAVSFYRKAVGNSPPKQAVFFQFKIAECLQEQGQLDSAIEEYLKVKYLYPEDKSLVAKAMLRVAQIYEDKKDMRSAKDIYQKITQMDVQEAKYAKEKLDSLN